MLNDEIKNKKDFILSDKLICKIQGIVTKGLLSSYRGKYRKEPVFVNNPLTRETIYWPPDAKDVKS